MRPRYTLMHVLVVLLLAALLPAACNEDKDADEIGELERSIGATQYGPGVTLTPSSFPPISSATPAIPGTPTPPPPTVAAAIGTAAAGSGHTREVVMVARDNYFEWDPNRFEIPAQTTIRLTLKNEGSNPHNWHLLGADTVNGREPQTEIIPGGEETTITFLVTRPGRYTFRCDVHPVEMVGTLTVFP